MSWKSPGVWLVLIWITGIVAYSNTLSAPFVFDDLVEIVGNPALHDFDIGALARRYPTRITAYLTLAANYAMSGENVTSYHIVNILIHLLTASVIFFLVRGLAAKTPHKNYENILAGAVALLFVSHPIQTQAVTYIIQRLASLATLFYLLGLFLYAKARCPSTSLGVKNWLYVGSWLAILLAMFSKEIAFTAPIVILMIEWFFFAENRRAGNTPGVELDYSPGVKEAQKNAPRSATPEESLRDTSGVLTSEFHLRGGIGSRLARWRYIIPYLLLLPVIPLTLWMNRPPLVERDKPLTENVLPQPDRPLTVETSSISRGEYLLTEINVVRTYLRLLILPVNQNLDYDYPISHSLFEARTLGSLILLLGVAGLGIYLHPRNRLASFGILFFFLTLSVESSFFPIRDVIYEHRLYLPSFGIFLAGVALAEAYLKWRAVIWGGLGVVLLLAGATFARNTVWQSEISLWSDVVQKSPNKARGYTNLGAAYVKAGQEDRALPYFERAIQLQPTYAEAYNNLGLITVRQGDYRAALELFEKAVELEPFYVHALNNLGVAYLKLDRAQEAVKVLELAVSIDPAFVPAQENLRVAKRRVQN